MSNLSRVILYTCGLKKRGGSLAHPCARAMNALDRAGYEYDHHVLGGYRFVPWTWRTRNRERAEVERISGTKEVPVLVLDGGGVVSGSSRISRWAEEHPAARENARS